MVKVLITGSVGFIGSALTARLLDKGHKVFGYDTKIDPLHDILNESCLREAMDGIDVVVHCAAIAGINTVGKAPADTVQNILIGTWNVLTAASMLENLTRFVNFSTSEIYGTEAFRVIEDSPASIAPVGYSRWVYAASKLAGEHMTKAFHLQHGLPTVTVRPFNVYGPGQIGDSAMKTFIEKAINDEDITVYGGDQIRAWCYIDDFIDGLMPLLTDDSAIGETYNIGNERASLSIHGLAGLIVGITGSKSGVWVNRASEADIALRVPSCDKLRKLCGYEAKVGLEEGIKRTEEWIRNENG